MQPLTDIAIDPAGNVWVADNWQRPESCFAPFASEVKSTLCEGRRSTANLAQHVGPIRQAGRALSNSRARAMLVVRLLLANKP